MKMLTKGKVNPIGKSVGPKTFKDIIKVIYIMSEQPTSFLLYDQLYEQNKSAPKLSTAELTEMMGILRKLDRTGMDLVFVLVRVHSLRNNESKVFDIPYKGEKINEVKKDDEKGMFGEKSFDVKFDVRQFPTVLQRILLNFAKMHLADMKLKEIRE